jgi:hypothetical protein
MRRLVFMAAVFSLGCQAPEAASRKLLSLCKIAQAEVLIEANVTGWGKQESHQLPGYGDKSFTRIDVQVIRTLRGDFQTGNQSFLVRYTVDAEGTSYEGPLKIDGEHASGYFFLEPVGERHVLAAQGYFWREGSEVRNIFTRHDSGIPPMTAEALIQDQEAARQQTPCPEDLSYAEPVGGDAGA